MPRIAARALGLPCLLAALCGCGVGRRGGVFAPVQLILDTTQEVVADLFQPTSRGLARSRLGPCEVRRGLSAAETRRVHGYRPEDGVCLKFLRAGVQPTAVARNETASLLATYALLAPGDDKPVQVVETRVVTLGGKTIAEASVTLDRTAGTHTSTVPFLVARRAARGDYEVTTTLAFRTYDEGSSAPALASQGGPLKTRFTVRR